MKNIIYLLTSIFLTMALCACGSSGDGRDSRLVGTWVVDRILGDNDNDEDSATLQYYANGLGRVYADGETLDIAWEAFDDVIYTTIVDYAFTVESRYELTPSTNVLTTVTRIDEDTEVTEKYYRFINNHPEEFFGSWTLISATDGGEPVEGEATELVFEENGVGSFQWGVTEDRLILVDPVSLDGGAWEYSIYAEEGVTYLRIVETDDFGDLVAVYSKD